MYLRSFDEAARKVEDEPGSGSETVLCLNLKVESDPEPTWPLMSDRAQATGHARNLSWADRERHVRIGALSDSQSLWRRGSILNRLTDESADASTALLAAAREAARNPRSSTGASILRSCAPGVPNAFLDAAIRIREQSRMIGRRVPPRAAGSPLLLKGLEADIGQASGSS